MRQRCRFSFIFFLGVYQLLPSSVDITHATILTFPLDLQFPYVYMLVSRISFWSHLALCLFTCQHHCFSHCNFISGFLLHKVHLPHLLFSFSEFSYYCIFIFLARTLESHVCFSQIVLKYYFKGNGLTQGESTPL